MSNEEQQPYLSVGIDVGADISWMSIALTNQLFVGKPYKITHTNVTTLEKCVEIIKEAEEANSLESRIFLESTGVYHYPLFCYLCGKGFKVYIINPIITKNSTNINIRKVHNDRFDSKKVALVGLKPDLKTSIIPSGVVLDLRNLMREYYNLMDSRSAYVNKLQGQLRMVFPQYAKVFSKVTTDTSLTLLDKYGSPQAFLDADMADIMATIRQTARFGIKYAQSKYDAIIGAAKAALSFGYSVPSNFSLIRLYIRFIRKFDDEIDAVLSAMNDLVAANENFLFVQQIRLIQSIKGAGFLTAVTVMCELGDFSAFVKPKQLFAYFGLDPDVKQSGNFVGTKNKMSKRGSALARRAIFTIALINIGHSKKGVPHNQVLSDFYHQKCKSKPKLVALGAVMHKVCNIIFAVLRDHTPFVLIPPDDHIRNYQLKGNALS